MAGSLQVLFAMFQGGGNIPLIMPVVTRLVARGHQVHVMAGPGVRQSRLPVSAAFLQRICAAGAIIVPFRDPDIHPLDHASPARGLIGSWVPKAFRDVQREAQATLWAPAWAEQFSKALQKARPDVVVIDFVLLGAIAAAEAAGIPAVVLMHNVLSGLCPAFLHMAPAGYRPAAHSGFSEMPWARSRLTSSTSAMAGRRSIARGR